MIRCRIRSSDWRERYYFAGLVGVQRVAAMHILILSWKAHEFDLI